MNHCSSCVSHKRTPPVLVDGPHRICVDCWLATPQERQDEFARLQEQLARANKNLRDLFAASSISGLAVSSRADVDIAEAAYVLADSMLKARDATEAEPEAK